MNHLQSCNDAQCKCIMILQTFDNTKGHLKLLQEFTANTVGLEEDPNMNMTVMPGGTLGTKPNSDSTPQGYGGQGTSVNDNSMDLRLMDRTETELIQSPMRALRKMPEVVIDEVPSSGSDQLKRFKNPSTRQSNYLGGLTLEPQVEESQLKKSNTMNNSLA